MNLRDRATSVIARHSGLAPMQRTVLRLGPGPVSVWEITPPVKQDVALARIRWFTQDGLTLSPSPEIESAGIGWLSQAGSVADLVWLDGGANFETPGATYNAFLNTPSPRPLLTTAPAPGDRLVFLLGDFVDQMQLSPATIAAGRIVVEVGFHAYDEWGDLPDAP